MLRFHISSVYIKLSVVAALSLEILPFCDHGPFYSAAQKVSNAISSQTISGQIYILLEFRICKCSAFQEYYKYICIVFKTQF